MKNPDGSVTMSFKVAFTRGSRGQRHAVPEQSPLQPSIQELRPINAHSVPRITKMLVLGYHFERLVREGKFKNYAEIARLTGLSRARVTQIVNLRLLAPDIQEAILFGDEAKGTPQPRMMLVCARSHAGRWRSVTIP